MKSSSKCQVTMRSKQGTTHQSCDTPGQLWSHPTKFCCIKMISTLASHLQVNCVLSMDAKNTSLEWWMDFGATSTLGVFFNNNFVLLSVVLEGLFWAKLVCFLLWILKHTRLAMGEWTLEQLQLCVLCVCVFFLVIILFCYLFWRHCFRQS